MTAFAGLGVERSTSLSVGSAAVATNELDETRPMRKERERKRFMTVSRLKQVQEDWGLLWSIPIPNAIQSAESLLKIENLACLNQLGPNRIVGYFLNPLVCIDGKVGCYSGTLAQDHEYRFHADAAIGDVAGG